MTVFVAQQPRAFRDRRTGDIRVPDLTPALQYGPLHFILSDRDHPSVSPDIATRKAKRALENFGDDDYLLWAGGDPAALLICSMVAAAANMGRIKFLRWERARPSDVVANDDTPGGYYAPCEVSYA